MEPTVHEPASPLEEDATASPDAAVPNEEGLNERGLIEDELVVEEISIDGMCGVY